MITLVSAIVGFLTSALPDIVKLLHGKIEKNNQVKMLQMQLDAIKQNNELVSDKLDSIVSMKENLAVHRNYDMTKTKSNLINALRASVRPTITYLFFILFATVKVTCLINFLDSGSSLYEAMTLIWDKSTQYLFSAILAFWFGTRQMEKIRD